MKKVVAGGAGILYVLLGVVGIVIHIWSIYIIYTLYGAFWGIVSVFFPVVAEVFIVIIMTLASGTFLTIYTTVVLAYLTVTVILAIVISMFDK